MANFCLKHIIDFILKQAFYSSLMVLAMDHSSTQLQLRDTVK